MARRDTTGTSVLLQDQPQQETKSLHTNASCLHKHKLKPKSTEIQKTCLSSKAALAEGHIHTDWHILRSQAAEFRACRGEYPLALGLMLSDQWPSKIREERKLFWQALGVPGDLSKLVPEKWQYVQVNFHPEDLNGRASESVRVCPPVRWGIWSRTHSWVHMPFTLTYWLWTTAQSWLHFRLLYRHPVCYVMSVQ